MFFDFIFIVCMVYELMVGCVFIIRLCCWVLYIRCFLVFLLYIMLGVVMSLFFIFFVLERDILVGVLGLFVLRFIWFDDGLWFVCMFVFVGDGELLFRKFVEVEKYVLMSFLFWMFCFILSFIKGCELWVIV